MQVICTQPRKTAAKALAIRVATEYAGGNENWGRSNGLVGYHVGGDHHFDEGRCRIKFMTEAVFLTEMLNRADLSRLAANCKSAFAVVLDPACDGSLLWFHVL